MEQIHRYVEPRLVLDFNRHARIGGMSNFYIVMLNRRLSTANRPDPEDNDYDDMDDEEDGK